MLSKEVKRYLGVRKYSTSSSSFDPTKLIGQVYEQYNVNINHRDSILYALSVGFSQDPMNISHFRFTYENDQNFQIFPSMSAALALHKFPSFLNLPGFPQHDPFKILHGEEDVEILKPIQIENGDQYKVVEKIMDMQDKGKFTSLIVEKSIQNLRSQEVHSRVISTYVMLGLTGYGYKGSYKSPSFPKKPERNPDHESEERTSPNQAILYRLNGDLNPLHIDPRKAAISKFDRPILHGLCTFGNSSRVAYDKFVNDDATKIQRIVSRFTAHVFPGETLKVSLWKQDDHTIYYETDVKERGVTALKGYMLLN
ncbi:like domain containing protein [Stylonychia lemnae]|uniref:Like domain containing protein n=1 Tax=Stylonychia lemnae TaxID=5949 RepID=A0A078ANW3_STYLE|nr:like domain containing protein [Stylonychia lemnae]|eukprot:CDW84050.1 like domain containing protein [Stylonychia lemnae]